MINPIYQAIEEFGRDGFYIAKTIKSACLACVQGPTGQSVENCTACDNKGYIESTYYVPIRAIISWRQIEERNVMIGAIVVTGDCAVAITQDDYTGINIASDRFFVDGKELKLAKIVPSDHNVLYVLGLVYG